MSRQVAKQIIAGSANLYQQNKRFRFSSVFNYAVAATRSSKPKVCFIGTANGDDTNEIERFYRTCRRASLEPNHLQLFPTPNHTEINKLILSQDIIWVSGGSTANLLAVWKVHGLSPLLEKAWGCGVVLTGNSAGSICWSKGGLTDSYGSELKPIINGLGILPYSSIVHYDNQPQRKLKARSLIGAGILPAGFATEDGVAIHYINVEINKAVSNIRNKYAYEISRSSDEDFIEHVIDTEFLPS